MSDPRVASIRRGLVEAAIEVQALGNRVLHVGAPHRQQAVAVRANARALAVLCRSLMDRDQFDRCADAQSLLTFFPVHGDKDDMSD